MVQESWSDILDKNLYQDLFGGRYAFPIANEKNRALEKQLKEKQKEVAVYNVKLQESNLRIETISDHFRDVQQQLQYTQQICKARQRELDAEVSLQKLLYHEEQWFLQQIQQYKKEIKELHEKQAARENSVTQYQHIIEEIKTAMQWDNSALGAWLDEQACQEEDILALLKYTEHDESKIKSLSNQPRKTGPNDAVTHVAKCELIQESKDLKFRSSGETFHINTEMNCTSKNLIYCVKCAGCGLDYIGQTRDQLGNRMTIHRQQINHPELRQIGLSKHLDQCVKEKHLKYSVVPFYKVGKDCEQTRKTMEKHFIHKYKLELNEIPLK
ncbi:coiled-coil domain-containing protein 39-like [Tachypleus tridentatus]|uniref:coiled-coil domain-containing protein 39-like n=1 Tax=Tachypleus tridentatus TaxID=6853 RepID=UPI003FCF91F0